MLVYTPHELCTLRRVILGFVREMEPEMLAARFLFLILRAAITLFNVCRLLAAALHLEM